MPLMSSTSLPPLEEKPSSFNGITSISPFPPGFLPNSDPTTELTLTPIEDEGDRPDFSILMTVTTRNCYFLQRALESLRIQFWKNLELIVCADHTALVDEISEFLQDNQMRGEVMLCEAGLNRSQKFLECVKVARGKWSVIFDCDDLLPTGALEKLDLCLRVCPKHDYFTTGQAHIDTKNTCIKVMPVSPNDNTVQAIRASFRQKHLWGFRTDARPALSEALRSPYVCEDYHFFATLALRGLMPLCIPFPLCCYRRHTMQLTQREKESVADMCQRIQKKMDIAIAKGDAMLAMKSEALVYERFAEMEMMRQAVRVTLGSE